MWSNKREDLRNFLVLQGVSALWHLAQWVSRSPPNHILPAFLNLNGRRIGANLISILYYYIKNKKYLNPMTLNVFWGANGCELISQFFSISEQLERQNKTQRIAAYNLLMHYIRLFYYVMHRFESDYVCAKLLDKKLVEKTVKLFFIKEKWKPKFISFEVQYFFFPKKF